MQTAQKFLDTYYVMVGTGNHRCNSFRLGLKPSVFSPRNPDFDMHAGRSPPLARS